KPRRVDLQNILPGFVALVDDHRRALSDVVKAREDFDILVLDVERKLALGQLIEAIAISTYIIAPPNSSVVGTADADTLPRSGAQPRPAFGSSEITHAVLDEFYVDAREVIA